MLLLNLTDGTTEMQFKIPQTAKDVTLEQVIHYQQHVETQKPESLKECQALESESERLEFIKNLTDEQYAEWFDFRLNQVKYWGNVPEKFLQHIPMSETEPGRMGLADLVNYITEAIHIIDSSHIESFELAGEWYKAPPNPVNLYDHSKTDPMRGATLGEYATSQELYRALTMMQQGEAYGIVHMLAVCFRKEGEDLPIRPNEQTEFIRQRVELFKKLPYDVAMRAGFFLVSHRLNSTRDFQSLQAILEVMTGESVKSTDFIRSFQQLLKLVFSKIAQ